MFKKIKSTGKKTVSIEEHKSSLEPSNEKDPRARLESEEERKERRRSERDGKERKSTRKSVKYKLDEDGNKIPRESKSSDSDRKLRKSSSSSSSKHRRSSKSKSTDREKKIALHAKARREAERQRKKDESQGIQDLSLETKDYEPGLKVEIKGKQSKGGSNSVHAQRFDNIYSNPLSDTTTQLKDFKAPIYPKSDDDVEFLLDALADNFVFNTLDEEELETLVNAFENFECREGEEIIRQGETGGHFYILRKGTVAFMVDGDEVGRAVTGNSFGELALLYNAPRAATCMAVDGKAGLWRVDQVTFRKLLAAHTIQNDDQTKDVLRKV
eukprot:CAMPEP_0201691784 /NCGR_PEP_ID=MMETSP0578-20130828/4849_1 /ASSEMBLY_ACC=CAM_ASM_000663 /TAXON_ID=267565 /ORGANISM="Skeletonema grethea, Strain CCMP 1804" /LENGTH=326 /DNA_ID=CAMNT_0048177047 /DNA_START=248 /DNA_END=1224 /DNA_ORIENTATION=-